MFDALAAVDVQDLPGDGGDFPNVVHGALLSRWLRTDGNNRGSLGSPPGRPVISML
jgi:hypothetical protein